MKKYLIKFHVCEREFSEPQVKSYTRQFVCFHDACEWAMKMLELFWGVNDSAEILCIRREKGE